MRIGKNIHSENKKKVYRKPKVEVVEVDRDIVLMAPSDTTFPDKPSAPENSTNDQYPNINNKTVPPSKTTDNPFGGGTPNYER